MSRTDWPSLLEWTLAFGLFALTFIGAASIGLFVAPFAIVVMILVVRRNRDWPEAPLGGLLGVGAICLFIAYRNRAYVRCPPSGTTIRLGPGELYVASCHGINPLAWLIVGLLLAAAGVGGYLVFRRRLTS